MDLGRHETFLVHVQEAIAIPGHEGDVQYINALLQPDDEEGKRLLLEEDQGGPQRDLVEHMVCWDEGGGDVTFKIPYDEMHV